MVPHLGLCFFEQSYIIKGGIINLCGKGGTCECRICRWNISNELTPERRQAILCRSQEDVSAVLEVVTPMLKPALRVDGDAESLRQHQQFKADITAADLFSHPRGD